MKFALVKPRIEKISNLFEDNHKIHVFFCLILLFVLGFIVFSSRYAISLVPRAIFTYLLLLASTYSGRWISRRWLLNEQWVIAAIMAIIFATSFSFVGVLSYMYFLNFRSNENGSVQFLMIIPIFVILFLFSGGFIAVIRSARREQVKVLRLSQQRKESELTLLHSQLSPHFLFNTLNNLYGLSITQHEKIPDLLLRLSELLRYSIYETNQELVTLNDELGYIKNYIELEKIRIGNRLLLHIEMDKVAESIKIAPMVFIVFVENSFKHSKNSTDHRIHININLSVRGDTIHFDIENSLPGEKVEKSTCKDGSGLGIGNTVKRLDLLYAGEYSLEQKKENGYYKVHLQLKIK
jgi:sensor histidine kinase YesM